LRALGTAGGRAQRDRYAASAGLRGD